MATDGTSLESIESGEVANTADSGRMQAILRDMNASGSTQNEPRIQMPSQPQLQEMQAMPSRQPMPPMLQVNAQQQQQQIPMQRMPPPQPPQQYIQMAEEEDLEPKKNAWSSVLDYVRDPLFVILLFFVLSLPAFHTFVGKYASWMFATGGEMSMVGVAALAVAAGLVFGIFQTGCNLVGI